MLDTRAFHNKGSALAGPLLFLCTDVILRQVAVGVFQKPLPVQPDSSLRSERLNGPNARPEDPHFIRNTETEKHDIDLVPADSKLERFMSSDEPMCADASPRWNELDQIFECRWRGWVGHMTKIRI